MDKDSVILKHQQIIADESEVSIENLRHKNNDQAKRLADMQAKLAKLGAKPIENKALPTENDLINEDESVIERQSYDELYDEAKKSLTERGLDADSLDFAGLVSEEELDQIIGELNKPLPRKAKWTKDDFMAVYIAAVVGVIVDFILGNRDNKLTGKGSKFSKWLNETFHKGKHATNAPIDNQSKGHGGPFHREKSRGHDLARFADGIKMFKEGKFESIFADVPITETPNGTPYKQLKTIEAIIRYAEHMFADLFSELSLPFPGYSYFMESSNSKLVTFASEKMYHQGFNCKNVIIQSASTIAIDVIIHLYFSIMSFKKYKEEAKLSDDYSNIEAMKAFFSHKDDAEKLNEMLLVAHAIVTAFNLGKVYFTSAYHEINVSEILSVIKYGTSVVSALNTRYSEYSKLIYYSHEVNETWKTLDGEYRIREEEYLKTCPDIVI